MFRFLLSVLLLSALFQACSRKLRSSETINTGTPSVLLPDYGHMRNWAAHPWKSDPSDSIPQPLTGKGRDSIADVFFLYPTSYTGKKNGWNAEIGDSVLNHKTDYSSILYQASVFSEHCRVFAPRYRQAHLSAFFVPEEASYAAFDTAYSDLKKAFQYYLDHYHQNRPVIIAGHSQGGLMAIRILQDFFDGKPLQEFLVAAYIVGWPVSSGSFKNIPVCRDSVQTGCFCSWRTFRKGYIPDYITKEEYRAVVTNPLNWRTDSVYAGREMNRGSILRNFNVLEEETTDAQVQDGVLWVDKPKFRGSVFFTTKNYHIGDINLFYMNIRHNVEQRIQIFLNK